MMRRFYESVGSIRHYSQVNRNGNARGMGKQVMLLIAVAVCCLLVCGVYYTLSQAEHTPTLMSSKDPSIVTPTRLCDQTKGERLRIILALTSEWTRSDLDGVLTELVNMSFAECPTDLQMTLDGDIDRRQLLPTIRSSTWADGRVYTLQHTSVLGLASLVIGSWPLYEGDSVETIPLLIDHPDLDSIRGITKLIQAYSLYCHHSIGDDARIMGVAITRSHPEMPPSWTSIVGLTKSLDDESPMMIKPEQWINFKTWLSTAPPIANRTWQE